MVTFEEASRCPKCNNIGTETAKHNGPNGSTVHTITCMNTVCIWFETGWIIQRNSDGTIPVREASSRAPKQFPAMPGMTTERAQSEVEAIVDDAPRER